MTIGLGWIILIMSCLNYKKKLPVYEEMVRFWIRVLGLIFSIGVATGVVLEFEFGSNWATYSRYVGDIFGSPLAAEGLFAFFLESVFLGVLLFGWNRVSRRMHLISALLVAFGATLSAFWIIVANSWMHTPAGYQLLTVNGVTKAVITDFWSMVFNPSTLERLSHVLSGAFLTGSFLVISIAAYYHLKGKHTDFAKKSMRIALLIAVITSFGQLGTGHISGVGLAKNQPAKLAAIEGHYVTSPADQYMLGWVDEPNQRVVGIGLPRFLSVLIYLDPSTPVKGLNDFPVNERPPVQPVFQTFHLMVGLGLLMILISIIALIMCWKDRLFSTKWMLWILIPSFILPQAANQLGWIATEVGRQPWIVQGMLRTSDAISRVVTAGQVWLSFVIFSLVYTLLLVLFLYLLTRKIKQGPETKTLTQN
jgi:cytochrome d ubiquinol oxidase subunit I